MAKQTFRERKDARLAFMQSCRAAHASGKLTDENFARCWRASRSPAAMQEIQTFLATEGGFSVNGDGEYAAIDWERVIAFIKQWLPVIIRLIMMFISGY